MPKEIGGIDRTQGRAKLHLKEHIARRAKFSSRLDDGGGGLHQCRKRVKKGPPVLPHFIGGILKWGVGERDRGHKETVK